MDFLDVTFDLTLGTYKPYSKPNDTHVYVHRQSNHPPPNLKSIPKAVKKDCLKILQMRKYFIKQLQNIKKPFRKVAMIMNLNSMNI